jgi:ParB-like chromosome segregation protein Spo0J
MEMRLEGKNRGASEVGSTLTATKRVRLDELDERYAELRLSRPGLVAALRRSLERDGQLRPLLVNLERNGQLALVDGFKRKRALHELGHDSALAWVVHLDDAGVRVAIMAYNTPHRGLCELEEAWVVRSLVRNCGLQQRRVAGLLGHHPSWVCRRLMVAERLDEPVQEDMRLGLINPTIARELGRLPRGKQTPVALSTRNNGLSSRQCAALVERALSCHDNGQLKALLSDPWPRLMPTREPAEPPPDQRLSQSAEALRHPLLGLERAAHRWCDTFGQQPASSLSSAELGVVASIAVAARDRCGQALGRIDELLRLTEGS